jgi:hypothetical protein
MPTHTDWFQPPISPPWTCFERLRVRSVLIAISEYDGRAICQAQIERSYRASRVTTVWWSSGAKPATLD